MEWISWSICFAGIVLIELACRVAYVPVGVSCLALVLIFGKNLGNIRDFCSSVCSLLDSSGCWKSGFRGDGRVTSFAVEEWSVLLLNGSWIVTAGCAWLPLYCFLGLGLQFWAVVTQRFCSNLGEGTPSATQPLSARLRMLLSMLLSRYVCFMADSCRSVAIVAVLVEVPKSTTSD